MSPAMFCFKCGTQLVPGAAFCSSCGTAVPQAPPPIVPPIVPTSATIASTATAAPLVVTRPGVITFLAVLHFIGGAFWLLVGISSCGASPAGADAAIGLVMGPVFLLIGAAQIFCGLGLLRLRPYGRTLQLVFAWIGLIGIPVGTIISVLILIYMFKPGIKLIFQGRPGDDFTADEVAAIKADTASSGAMVAIVVVVCIILGIAVIGIGSAIAVPALLRARNAGNEAGAIASLRAVQSAEVAYSSTCAAGGYAVSLDDLAKPPTNGGSGFISSDLGQNGVVRSGYIITVTRDESPITADVSTAAATCNGSKYQPASSYFASAEPLTPGSTGLRYFAVDGRGTIWESLHPISNPITNSTGITPVR